MYAELAASTGWTWEYIGERMTLPRLEAMQKHWAEFPPVHKVLAAFAGVKPAGNAVPEPRPSGTLTNADIWRDVKTDPRKVQWKTIN